MIDLQSLKLRWLRGVGAARHLVIGPQGSFLYATLNAEGRVAKINLDSGKVVRKIATGRAPAA